jgi:Legionella pneumophila major outer membrane protein precursor
LNCSASITGAYTWYEGSASSAIGQTAPNFIRSLAHHPGSLSAVTNYLAAGAAYDLDFTVADLGYSGLLFGGPDYALDYFVGGRYASLDQDALLTFTGTPFSSTTVATNVDLDAAGLQLGLDGRHRLGVTNFSVYGRSRGSLLAGRFSGSYLQRNTFNGALEALANWQDDRLVPIWEYELGLAWQSANGHLRLSAGYRVDLWFNMVTTPTWIDAVQTEGFSDVNLDDTLSFDGLVVRLELRR